MSISFDSDEHIERFRAESDRAFLAMQAACDREMEQFLKSHGEEASFASFQTPQFTWGQAALSVPTLANAYRTAQAAAPQFSRGAGPSRSGRSIQSSSAPTIGGLADLGESLREELAEEGQEALHGAKGWLRSTTMDLGERARREAAAMREAARKAMEEETSLRGLKDRARKELEAAKQRMKAELEDAAADAKRDLEGMALGKLATAQEQGFAAAEAAAGTVQRELDELLEGRDS
jgi:hypothetical protein